MWVFILMGFLVGAYIDNLRKFQDVKHLCIDLILPIDDTYIWIISNRLN